MKRSMMQIILLSRVRNLGAIGEMVSVKRGFARNYLLPQGKALRATADNIKEIKRKQEELEKRDQELLEEAQKNADKIKETALVFVRQASESGQLYGSVSVRDIKLGLAQEGYDIPAEQILLGDRIKEVGLHPCQLALHAEITAPIVINVARNESEAQTQWQEAQKKHDNTSTKDKSSKPAAKDDTQKNDNGD